MRKRYQLKTTVPSWIFLAVAVAMFAISWVGPILMIINQRAVMEFIRFNVPIPFYVILALDFLPYLIWIVFLIIGKRLKNPFLTVIVYFSYAIVSYAATMASSVMFSAAAGSTSAVWSAVVFNSAYLLLVLLPCFLNAIWWRKSNVWAACGAFALLGTGILMVGFVLSTIRIAHYGRLDVVMQLADMTSAVFMVLCWLSYGLMIRRIPGEQTAAGPAAAPLQQAAPGENPALRSIPPYVVSPVAQNQIPDSQTAQQPEIPASQTTQPAGAVIGRPPEAEAPDAEPRPAAAQTAQPVPAEPAPAVPVEPSVPQPAPVPAAQPAPQVPETIFCMNCGAKLPGSAKFCSKCGAKIASISD